LKIGRITAAGVAVLLLGAISAPAQEGAFGWVRGDWYLTVGASGFVAPKFEGSSDRLLSVVPMISLGKVGPEARFVSRNDNISLSLYDTGSVRAGLTGKLIWGRDSGTAGELNGLDPVKFGGEAGVFAEVYPTNWLRVRGEVRKGFRSHDGVVADLSADAFVDVTDRIRVSAGPRLSLASGGYFDSYYGVNSDEAAKSGLSKYDPGGGVKSVGVGGAVTWKTTDQITTSVFGEYSRLQGPAADSSLVKQRGSVDQLLLGVSATYKFDFQL
jgi:outer membrane protein